MFLLLPSSTAYTYCPDGKDQDCDGKIDNVVGEEIVGIYTLTVNNNNGESCDDVCNSLGKCAYCGTDEAGECSVGKWVSSEHKYPYAEEWVNYGTQDCSNFQNIQQDCLSIIIKCSTKINDCVWEAGIRPTRIKCECKRKKYA